VRREEEGGTEVVGNSEQEGREIPREWRSEELLLHFEDADAVTVRATTVHLADAERVGVSAGDSLKCLVRGII
jgi:hypothetical protein